MIGGLDAVLFNVDKNVIFIIMIFLIVVVLVCIILITVYVGKIVKKIGKEQFI